MCSFVLVFFILFEFWWFFEQKRHATKNDAYMPNIQAVNSDLRPFREKEDHVLFIYFCFWARAGPLKLALAKPLFTLRRYNGFSEVLRSSEVSSQKFQNIYKMAASKISNLANYPFGAASRPQKGVCIVLASLRQPFCIYSKKIWEEASELLRTSEKPLRSHCTFVMQIRA